MLMMTYRIELHVAKVAWGYRVRFLGHRKDISRLMAASDVLAHSAGTEGFGLALVEAIAAGLPVVATDVGGIPEVLVGTDAIMVPPDKPGLFRDAVLRVLRQSPDEVAQAARRGRHRAVKGGSESRPAQGRDGELPT